MDSANVDRLRLLLRRHEEILEEKRLHPEAGRHQASGFRERFNGAVRGTILPVLEDVKNVMIGHVESAALFHRLTAAGLKVKLDRWEDFERSLLFFGDPGTRTIRITHEGIGFGLLSRKVDVADLTPKLVEEEAMKFLRRVFGDEQLRRPEPPPAALAGARRYPADGGRMVHELVRV
jgi:hypothetical protein